MINGRMEVLECHTFLFAKETQCACMYHYFSSNILFLSCQAPVLSSNNNNQTKQGVLQNKHGHMTNHYAQFYVNLLLYLIALCLLCRKTLMGSIIKHLC